VAADAVKMRREIALHKPAHGPFDVKLGPGGLVDLEFAVQVNQLSHLAGLTPCLGDAIADLVAAGLLPPELVEAHQLLTRMLVTFRLVCPTAAEPSPASRPVVAQACGTSDWESLLAAHAAARQTVSEIWSSIAAPEEARC